MTEGDALQPGRESFDRKAWGAAFAQFTAAEQQSPLGPDDLERLAKAAYLIGKDAESADAWTRAHHGFLDEGDIERAVRCAFWLGFQLILKGEMAPAGGWFERARRTLEAIDHDTVEHGYLLQPNAIQALFGGDPETALGLFNEVGRIAQRFGEADLLTMSRFGGGQALISLGRVHEGMASLDEAMVAVTSGECSPTIAGLVYCGVIEACQDLLDIRRAQEWTTALSRWCEEQPDLVPYRGQCLVHRAQIMQLHGSWTDAIGQAELACSWLSKPPHPAVGMAYYQLAELHRLRGDFDRAEEAYRQAHQFGRSPQPGLAQLRLAQGKPDAAKKAIGLALDEADDPARRSTLLPAHIDISIASGDVPAARVAADELSAFTADVDVPLLRALAAHAQGIVLHAEGDARTALNILREAWKAWCDIDAPYEAARVRVLMGLACRALGDEETADMELGAAITALRELGARPEIARVEGLSSKESSGGLSVREREVLGLVAAGKTNKAIADDLVISEKTVARHVSNIFTKLGVSTRSAATAYAYEHKLV